MKEVSFKFIDGSEYIVRPNGIGDTIVGDIANSIRHRMNIAYAYNPVPYKQKIQFIVNLFL